MLVEDIETQTPSFETCIRLLDSRFNEIQEETWATEEPIVYLTADEKLISRLNRRRKKEGKEPIEYAPNFREEVAVTKPYKGNRSGKKPIHFDNITMYLLSAYNCKLAIGLEADDLLSIDSNIGEEDCDLIICSRDKDLRITPGIHYGWACGKNPAFGPKEITKIGYLEKKPDGKVVGGGLKFFYAQMIMGDSVDNIPGVFGKGPAFAYDLLRKCRSEKTLFNKVWEIYKNNKDSEQEAREYFKEQADLLWMCQAWNEDGTPERYVPYDER